MRYKIWVLLLLKQPERKLSGTAKGYIILVGLVVLSWAIFKSSDAGQFWFYQYAELFSGQPDRDGWRCWFYFVMVMGMFDFPSARTSCFQRL